VQGNPLTQVVAPFANIIRGYQRYVWLPGSVYGLILLAGLGGILLAWRRLGGEALLPWAISFAMILIPAATAEFDYRYVLPAVPFACLAAVMAFSPGTAGSRMLRRLAAGLRRDSAGLRRDSAGPRRDSAGPRRDSAGLRRDAAGAVRVSEVAAPAAGGAGPSGAGDDKRDLAADGA
jgi:hypothetical protein